MGGSNDSSNLIELTIEQHAEAHRILFEKYGHWQDELAWKGLAGLIPHEEAAKMASRNANTGRIPWNKGLTSSTDNRILAGENNGMFGREYFEQSERMKDNNPNKGQFIGEKNGMFGKERLDQSIRLSKMNKEKNKERNSTLLTCPYCNFTGRGIGNMHRWHFDNCKEKSICLAF